MNAGEISTQFPPISAQPMRRALGGDADALREAARKFVGQSFFAPMLKQMRESPFKSEIFSGGRGGQVFSSMLDGVLAERMGRGAGGKIVDALVKRLTPKGPTQP